MLSQWDRARFRQSHQAAGSPRTSLEDEEQHVRIQQGVREGNAPNTCSPEQTKECHGGTGTHPWESGGTPRRSDARRRAAQERLGPPASVRDVELPDFYETVARDAMALVGRGRGLWADLGCGSGGLGLALVRQCQGKVLLVDSSMDALKRAAQAAVAQGVSNRVWLAAGRAEQLPLRDSCLDLVVSRGSVFFWDDPVAGIREVHRVLRPGGHAMIGGGLGSDYPARAREAFIRERHEEVAQGGPEAQRRFRAERASVRFARMAERADLKHYEVVNDAGEPASTWAGEGIWLRFMRRAS